MIVEPIKPHIQLNNPGPLPSLVADYLCDGRSGQPIDLGDTLVIVPTAGAGRSIRRVLSKRGVLSPQFLLPMDAMLPRNVRVSSRLEREAAWAILLETEGRQGFEALVPGVVSLDTPEDRFGVAARLCNVCDQLAEAGLDPASHELPLVFSDDAPRWDAFGKLYGRYLELVAGHQLHDPNVVRAEQSKSPSIPRELKRVAVACIPDLPLMAATFLQSLENKGVIVDVLVWSPLGQADHLDALGRPDSTWWVRNAPRVDRACLVPANDPSTEAGLLLDHAARQNADFEIFAAAPESAVALAQEINWRDADAYLPEGLALSKTESAEILLGWIEFARSRRLRDLRVLLQKPTFLSYVVSLSRKTEQFTAMAALKACDRLIGQYLCENLESAQSWLECVGRTEARGVGEFLAMDELVYIAFKLLDLKLDGQGMLASVNNHRGTVKSGSLVAQELGAMADLAGQFNNSELLRRLPRDMRWAALRSDIMRKRIFPRAPDGAIEVQGWLEAPWSNAQTLIIAGCREGALPSGTYDDSFLPDGAKGPLGLATQDARLARDAYLLSCILASRPPAQVRLGFARLRNQGEPNRPSRLLFGCTDRELPERSSLLLRPTPRPKRGDRQRVDFKLQIPMPAKWPPESMRVTGFKSYLECPLRFYLGTILGLRKVDPDAREIPANEFGTVMHKVLEDFAMDKSLKHLRDADEIARKLSGLLDAVTPRYYGKKPSPVVQVQIETMRARLMAAATTEADIRKDGWTTLEAEFKVKAEDQRMLGDLAITGTLDRVDIHPEHGLRILDYKTFSQPKSPSKTHLGPRRARGHLPEADLDACIAKEKPQPCSWTDLQLPLYAWLARQIWPEHANKGVQVGYFLLPSDSEDDKSALKFFELTDDMQASAEKCGARITCLVKSGHFWPASPSSDVEYDNYEDWFMGEDPQKLIAEESAHRLNGNP